MAAITGAVVGAATGIASISSQRSAARRANRSQTQAADASLAEQRRQFDLTRSDLAPTIERGNLAGEREAEFLGLRGREAEQAAIDNFVETPGQRFLRERQERALLRNEAAIGGLGGGNVRTALQEQAFGIASTDLNNRIDRLGRVARGGDVVSLNQAGISANQSNNIASGIRASGDAAANAALRTNAARQSGLAAIAGAFTGSGSLFRKPKPPPIGRGT